MPSNMPSEFNLVAKKHQWLISQVDVQFPTPESVLGKELYSERERLVRYEQHSACELMREEATALDEIYKVDFHRLTVLFAQMQSEQWASETSKAHVLEFFAQITITDEHDMYIGFKNQQPLVCALATRDEDTLALSDFAPFECPSSTSVASSEQCKAQQSLIVKIMEQQTECNALRYVILPSN